MNTYEKVELKQITDLISGKTNDGRRTKFNRAQISRFNKTLFDNQEEYFVSFFIEKAEFRLHTQIRNDRSDAVRRFKSIDTAVKNIKKTGFKGIVLLKID